MSIHVLFLSSHRRCVAEQTLSIHCVVAGALEGLISTAHLYLELGVATPFLVSYLLPSLTSFLTIYRIA